MKKNKLKNKINNEKGSITIFVVTSMFFFLVILLSVYINNVNKNSNMDKDIKRIEQQYNVTTDDLEQAYQKIVSETKYPKPLLDTKDVDGNDILKNSDNTYKYFDGSDYHPVGTTNQEFPVLSAEPLNGGFDFNGANVITVSATIKTPTASSLQNRTAAYFIVGCTEYSGWDLYFGIDGKVKFSVNYDTTGNNYDILESEVLVPDKLYNVVAMITRGKMYMYITDEEGNTYSINNESSTIDTNFTLNQLEDIETLIGANPTSLENQATVGVIDANSGYEGYIYDVKIWDHVLIQEQIESLANEQMNLYGND